ncbi:restriction endonuclease subunit S [Megasphaera stantonii]|uniref:restriction endonuclease subunit S n=1 Tax=Megasphaera stantonii TaxID=2144175 RepID=UPI00320B91D9
MKEYVKLSEVCNIIMGQSPESNSYNELGNGLPFFQGNADFGELYPVTKMWCTEPKKIVEKNTLLISVRAPIGALNFSTERCCIGRGLAGITAKAPTDLKYIYYGLMNKKEELNRLGTGSTFKAINKKVLENTLIVKEKAERQHNIVKVLDKNILIIAHLQKQLYLLDELVKSRFVELFGTYPANEQKGWATAKSARCAVLEAKYGSSRPAADWRNSYPYLRMNNITYDGELDLSDIKFITYPRWKEDCLECTVKRGDVLFVK